MSLRFFLDEDSADRALLEAMRLRGLSATNSVVAQLRGANDARVLEWCAENGCVLVSHNVADFYELHQQFMTGGRHHSGMVLMRQQTLSIGEKLTRLSRIQAALSAEEMRDRVEFLSHW